MKIKAKATCVLSSMLLLVAQQDVLTTETKSYFVELLSHTGYPSFHLEFRILSKTTGKEEEFALDARFLSVRDLQIVQTRKLCVQGRLPRGGEIIAIRDLVEGKWQDVIWNYGSAFSPSKKYLIYRTHLPKMAPPDYRSSILLVYDLRKPPGENRIPGAQVGEFPGYPVFPDENATQGSYDTALGRGYTYLSPFLWSADSRQVVFFFRKNSFSHLALIDLSSGVTAPSIFTRRVEVRRLADVRRVPERDQERVAEGTYPFAVEAIQWVGSTRIQVRPYPQRWLPETIQMSLPIEDSDEE